MISCIFEDGGEANLRHIVVDALILKENKILLVKRVKKLIQGEKWALIGGYVQRDESTEQALSREVFEETGYRLNKIEFLTIINTPKRHNDERQNIPFIYVCEAGNKEGESDSESLEQKWFDLDNLPKEEEMAFDHFKIIHLYLNHQKDRFPNLIQY